MRSYAVLGTGAVGGLYGAWLQRAGFPVRFLARSDFEAIRDLGLEVKSPRGDFRLEKVEVYRHPKEMPPCDVALLAWKTTSNPALPGTLPHVLKPGGIIVVLQNGLHPEDEAAAAMPSARIISGLCFLCCRKSGPTIVEHQDYGSITIANYTGVRGRIEAGAKDIASDFEKAGVEIRVESDWKKARWKKLVWNIPFNGLCALHSLDTGEILKRSDLSTQVRELMAEVLAGSQLDGAGIEAAFADRMMEYTRKMRPYEPSMKLDRDAGRPMELQAIYGDVLERIESLDGGAPATRMLYDTLSSAESNLR
jgi:2-dehydropantoate 2-reductase